MRATRARRYIDQGRAFAASALALARREMALLGILLLIAASLWLFIEIADEVVEGEIDQIDRMIFLAFRNPADIRNPLGPPWLEEAALEITALGSFAVLGLIIVAALAWLLLLRKAGAAVLVGVSVMGGVLISSLLKTGFGRARPDLVPHIDAVNTLSFPSGHAMSAAVVYLTLAALLARAQEHRRLKFYLIGVAVTLTVLIGLSRVYLGVHWPSDVLAGWCVGSAWALMCWAVALWLARRNSARR
ncbi:MAG: superfamily [Alphaproteobacteria bacterium]|jgi:undecaprenyl-diphosphatase|nr:superfamily [Alphaproteobacteria bacterium]